MTILQYGLPADYDDTTQSVLEMTPGKLLWVVVSDLAKVEAGRARPQPEPGADDRQRRRAAALSSGVVSTADLPTASVAGR